jgi:hypothetical protein
VAGHEYARPAYWREYYRQKQWEWRAGHLYNRSDDAVILVFDKTGNIIEGRAETADSRSGKLTGVNKSRRTAKRNRSVRK